MTTCKDCLYVNICEYYAKILNQKLAQYCNIQIPFEKEKPHSEPCEFFKDCSRFVELPCKVGDSVFMIDEKEDIQECIVTNVNCKTQMVLNEEPWAGFTIVADPVDDSLPFPMIFTYSPTNYHTLLLTRKSAEQALKEQKRKCQLK